MGTTPNYGLPYPDPTDPVNDLDLHIKAALESVDTALSGFLGAPASIGIVAASGWTLNSGSVYAAKLGSRFAWIEATFTRAAGQSTITAATAGGNVSNSIMGTMPVDFRPLRTQYLATERGSESMWRSYVNAAGDIGLSHGAPGASIAAGESVIVADLYALF